MFTIEVITPEVKSSKPYIWGTFKTSEQAETKAKGLRRLIYKYSKVEVKFMFNEDEDIAFGKIFSDYANMGYSILEAERKTIVDLKEMFPNVKRHLGDYKISAEVFQQ